MSGPVGVVYLLHFDKPFKHARHYVGFCEKRSNVKSRLEYHAKGRGSRLMAAVTRAGISWRLVRLWEGTRSDERAMHSGHSKPYCPICSKPPRTRRNLREIQL